MLMTSLLLALAMAADGPADTNEPFMADCEITLIDNQAVPAADAGVLTTLRVQPGSRVEEGEEIGRIDDSEATVLLRIREIEYDTAKQLAESDIDIRHADMAARVMEAAYLKLKESNEKFKGTVTSIDILKAQLEWRRSMLAIEQAKQKSVEAKMAAEAKLAEVGAAKVALSRLILRAPFEGIVKNVVKKQDEWVAPGEAVVHLVGIKRLNVKGFLDANEWSQADVQNRKVTVEVKLPRGKTVKVPGKITYVSPVAVVGDLEVMAEIETPADSDLSQVRAGLDAAMTIHVNQPPVAAAAAVAPAREAPSRATPVRPTSTRPRTRN